MVYKKVKINDAVGMVLCHDITKIIPNKYKGPLFKRGHIIQKEDIELLKNIGKEHIYVIKLTDKQLHENDAALKIADAVIGNNVYYKCSLEGRINIYAQIKGLLKVNILIVNKINMINDIKLSTLRSNRIIYKDELLAGIKVIPLIINKNSIMKIKKIIGLNRPIQILPFKKLNVGVIITGNEICSGRTLDHFVKLFTEKAVKYDFVLAKIIFKPDNVQHITLSILEFKQNDIDLVIVTGGMSVDPDDVTPDAIKATGAEIVTYGTPVLPGAMFMLAYLDNNFPIIGLPACAMYSKITVFDLILPRIMVGEKLKRRDIAELGYGGLCMSCEICCYPHCTFGN